MKQQLYKPWFSILFLIAVVLLGGCENKPVTTSGLVGEYSDRKLSYVYKVYSTFLLNQYTAFGNTLSLRADSTYTYISCGSIINGVWNISSDSLNLNCLNARWRNDSLNKIRPHGCGKTTMYITKEGDLQDRFALSKDDNPTDKPMYAMIWLSKND